MSKKRKIYSPAEKAKIVLEVLREENTLNEIATNYGVSPQLISRWKIEFIENMPVVFDKKNAIDKIHFAECSYGYRRIQKELRKKVFQGIGKRRVRRYMDEMGIVAFYPGPNLSKRDLQERTYPYLLRNVAITHVNQVWGIDITYCGTPHGFMYLVAIIDWHSRFIVGWAMSNTMQTDFVIRAIEKAIKQEITLHNG